MKNVCNQEQETTNKATILSVFMSLCGVNNATNSNTSEKYGKKYSKTKHISLFDELIRRGFILPIDAFDKIQYMYYTAYNELNLGI